MAVLTAAAFISKWNARFANNTTRQIDEADMREFVEDIKDSFQSISGPTAVESWKSPCAVATTGNITLSGEQTIDGVLTSASRVLVKNQTTTSQNGIYVSAAGAWARSTDADAGSELEGAAVGVTQGTTQQNTVWLQTTDNITLGTSAINWQQIGFGFSSGITGTLTTNRIPYATGATTLGDDSALTWDATNDAITIGTARIHSRGSNNTFVGASSGNFTSSGGDNTAIGFQTLLSLTTGAHNAAIGYQSLSSNTTGSNNTAIGDGALDSVTTSSNNTAVGSASLALATGANNTAIGYQSGLNLTSGSRNVIIGANINAQSDSSNDQLSIQNIIFGTGNSGTGTTVSTGSIGIGVAAPATKLDVDGPVKVKSYTVAGVPSASSIAGAMIYVSNETGGAVIAFSDGTNWRRVTDRAIIS